MSEDVDVDDVIDTILQTWAAWGSSQYVPESERDILLNANVMLADLAFSLVLRLLEVGQRSGDPDVNNAISQAAGGMFALNDLRQLVAVDSRKLDGDSIRRIRGELGFDVSN